MSCECEVGIAVEAAKEGLFLSPGINFEWIGTKGPYGLSGKTAIVYESVMSVAIALGAGPRRNAPGSTYRSTPR